MNNKTTNATEQLVAWWSEFNSEVDEYEYIIILRAGEHGVNEDTFIPYPRKEILDVLCRFGVDNHIFTELIATVTGDELFPYLDALVHFFCFDLTRVETSWNNRKNYRKIRRRFNLHVHIF
jgi:hypothetical protein